MITGYFGVPGCGKTTLLAKIAQKEIKRKKYSHIYTINVEISGTEHISYEYIKKYKPINSLILIDEITMDADNRSFKTFTKEERDFYILHRHLGCDIIYATQNFENVDKKIRDLTHDLWYMSKSVVPILREFTTAKRIYRNININEYNSELTLGYRFCNLLETLFVSNLKIVHRKRWYKYFDSWDELSMKDRETMPEINKTPYRARKVLKIWKKLKTKLKKKKINDGLQYY